MILYRNSFLLSNLTLLGEQEMEYVYKEYLYGKIESYNICNRYFIKTKRISNHIGFFTKRG